MGGRGGEVYAWRDRWRYHCGEEGEGRWGVTKRMRVLEFDAGGSERCSMVRKKEKTGKKAR